MKFCLNVADYTKSHFVLMKMSEKSQNSEKDQSNLYNRTLAYRWKVGHQFANLNMDISRNML